jgi:hypothetical protein
MTVWEVLLSYRPCRKAEQLDPLLHMPFIAGETPALPGRQESPRNGAHRNQPLTPRRNQAVFRRKEKHD